MVIFLGHLKGRFMRMKSNRISHNEKETSMIEFLIWMSGALMGWAIARSVYMNKKD